MISPNVLEQEVNTEVKLVISDEYVDQALYLLENIRDNKFALGDLLVELTDLHGGYKSGVINYMAGKTGLATTTLYDYEAVSRRWSLEKRLEFPHLDWSFYRLSDPVDHERELKIAIQENLSVTKFKELIYPYFYEPIRVIRYSLTQISKLTLENKDQEEKRIHIQDKLKELLDEMD